jgi:hypothetical protein
LTIFKNFNQNDIKATLKFSKSFWESKTLFSKRVLVAEGIRKDKTMTTATKTSTVELLSKMFKNMNMGKDSTLDLLEKVSDSALKSDMTLQLNGYEGMIRKINEHLQSLGEDAKEENFITKMSAKMGTAFNTMMDDSPSHIADMMIQGSTMGMTDTTKLLRDYENTDASEASLSICRSIIKFEEENIERMKKHL